MNASVQTENITVWEFLSRKNCGKCIHDFIIRDFVFYEKAVIYSVIAVKALSVF